MNRAASFLFFLCSLANSSGQAWPKKISPPTGAGKYSVRAGAEGFVYQTKSFQIETFERHDHTLMTNFTKCLESVPLVLQSIPIPLYAPPAQKQGRLLLTADEKAYLDAGGAKNTAGFYHGAQSKIIINWDQFKNSTVETRVIQHPAFDLIIHEITHLSMDELMWRCEPWLTEGIAEYMAAAHLGRGNFDFDRIDRAVRMRIEKHTKSGVAGNPVINISNLVSLSSRAWLKRTAGLDPWETLKAYNCALLLTHYCFHGDSQRVDRTRRHFEEIHSIKTRRQKIPRLFMPNEAKQIEAAISAYWKKRGLTVTFEEDQ